jgi:hypothetical protein
VLIGSREDVAHLGYAIGVCPKCGREGAFTVTMAKRKLTLYIVAAIPMNTQMVLECGNCHVRFAIPKNEQDAMKARLISAEELNRRMLGNDHPIGGPPPAAMSGPTLYQQLQVDSAAELEVIDAAYRRLALRYHPDRDRSDEAVQRMQVLNEAKRVLSDPESRARYDESIGLALAPQVGASATRYSPPPSQPSQASRPHTRPEPPTPNPNREPAPPPPDSPRAFRADDV